MNDENFSYLAAGKWFCAVIVAYWLQIPNLMRLLLILMMIDYGSGFVAACKRREVSSEVGWWGLVKKTMTILLLLSCHVIERSLGVELKIEEIGALAYCVNEAASIVENAAKLNVPIPAEWVTMLLSAQRLRGRRASSSQLAELGKEKD